MRVLVGVFNQEEALVVSRGLLRDYKPSFEALASERDEMSDSICPASVIGPSWAPSSSPPHAATRGDPAHCKQNT